MTTKNRTAARKTLLVLEHHAQPLQPLWAVVTQYVAASSARLVSTRGGQNSWSITGPGIDVIVRGRLGPPRLEVNDGTVLTTRTQCSRWCERRLP